MMWIRPELVKELMRLAREGAPYEVCGLLVGHGADVTEVIPVRNSAGDPSTAYRLDDREFVRAMFSTEARGMSLVGFYHSHPSSVAMPSQTDIRQSAYPEALHLIIGLNGEPPLTTWRLANGRAEHVEMYIGDMPPVREPDMHRNAVVLASALTAVIILIVLSLVLLPPAPPVPAP